MGHAGPIAKKNIYLKVPLMLIYFEMLPVQGKVGRHKRKVEGLGEPYCSYTASGKQ